MIHIDTVKISIPLKKKFVVAKGQADVKTNMLAVLNNRYSGEAAASVQYGPTLEQIETDLRTGARFLEKQTSIDSHTLDLINKLPLNPIARSALIGMVLNYISGETHRYPWEILSLGVPVGIKSSFTVAIAHPDEMVKAITESNYPIIKVKMGNEEDTALLAALKDIKGKEIRVDANGGWSPEKAEEMIFYLNKEGIRIIEQPTTPDHIADWPHLKAKNEEVELVIDEGMNTLEDYKLFRQYVDGINIKMEKSGGILEAIRIADEARKDKKKIMLGCMVESSVGIAQSVYMSSLADYFDLDGPQLLADDIAQGINYDRENIDVDREIIGGPLLKRDLLEKYILG